MTLPVVLRSETELDAVEARDWYDRKRAGLGDEFTADLRKLLELVRSGPSLFARDAEGVRRARLRRFPYVTYFRVEPNRIEIIAILHGSRDPEFWRQRR